MFYSTLADAKEIDSLAVKNRKIGELWWGLNTDEKKKYYTLAKEESTPGVGHCGDWKTVSKILSNMNANVSFVSRWRSRVGALLATEPQSIPLYSEHTFMRAFITCSANGLRSVEFYVLCYGPNHYAVGTQCGVQYLQSHANIPMDFLHSHKGAVYTIQESSPLAYVKSRIYIWV